MFFFQKLNHLVQITSQQATIVEKKNQKKNQSFYSTHRILQNNYRILRGYVSKEYTECNLSELNRQGFRSSCITEIEKGQEGGLSKYYLYDIGYHFLTSEKIKIFKRVKID